MVPPPKRQVLKDIPRPPNTSQPGRLSTAAEAAKTSLPTSFGRPVQSDTLHHMTRRILPDLLHPGLRLPGVCGTAAGRASTARYAERGNRFWLVLHEVGLTATCCSRATMHTLLLEARMGLIDLAEYVAGRGWRAARRAAVCRAAARFGRSYSTRALAFNGKNTAIIFYRGGTHRLNFGRQSERIW